MLDVLETILVNVQGWSLLVHLHQYRAGSKIAGRVAAVMLDSFLRVRQCRRQFAELFMASRAVVIESRRCSLADRSVVESQGFLVVPRLEGQASLSLVIAHTVALSRSLSETRLQYLLAHSRLLLTAV